MDKVKMHGPSFDGSGRLVNRDVPAIDVRAYKAAGYVLGSLPEEPKPQKVETVQEPVKVKQAVKPKAKKK
jgi:hypothetical protein